MESAKFYCQSGTRICSAIELREWTDEEVRSAKAERLFCCTGCPESVFPRSIQVGGKQRPHFSLYSGRIHQPDCLLELARTAANGDDPSDADDSVPTRTPHPVHLTEPPTEYKVRTDDPQTPASSDSRASTAGTQPGSDATPSAATGARLIRTFAIAHLDMNRAQRRIAPIRLPGITDADRYQYAFRRLPQWEIERLIRPRVFYAQLRWTADLEDTGNEYRVALNAGHFDKDARTFDRPWVLEIPHGDWTKKAHNLFRREFDECVKHAKSEGLQPWVFALAQQREGDLAVLQVNARQHIAFIPLTEDRAPN